MCFSEDFSNSFYDMYQGKYTRVQGIVELGAFPKLAESDLIQGQYIFKFYNLKNICSLDNSKQNEKMMAGFRGWCTGDGGKDA